MTLFTRHGHGVRHGNLLIKYDHDDAVTVLISHSNGQVLDIIERVKFRSLFTVWLRVISYRGFYSANFFLIIPGLIRLEKNVTCIAFNLQSVVKFYVQKLEST